ncbi:MAG: hypothetical protein J6127_07825 [Clostridiales bacterium]|nr:hypothetical protein [Clostridiales bacterium]
MLLLKCSVYFFPLGDTNFDPFALYMQNAMEDPEILMNATFSDIPLSLGNLIFLAHASVADYLVILGGVLYCAVYIRQYRKDHKLEDPGDSGYLIPPMYLKPVSAGGLLLRMVIVFCFSVVIFLPAALFLLYLFLIFIIILPYVSMYPACYLSGDSGFFGSFIEMVKVTRGYYLVNARFMSLLLCLYFLGDWLTSALSAVLPTVAYVLGPAWAVIIALSFGRYVGMVYCRMREVPGGFRPSNHASYRG